jgi:hypothetical protein
MSGQGQKEGGRTLALLDELKAGQPGGLEYFSQCQFKPRCASKREKDGRELASAVKRALGRRRRAEDVREGRTVAEPEKRALVDPPAAGGERAVDLIEVVEHVVGRVDEEERLRRGGGWFWTQLVERARRARHSQEGGRTTTTSCVPSSGKSVRKLPWWSVRSVLCGTTSGNPTGRMRPSGLR